MLHLLFERQTHQSDSTQAHGLIRRPLHIKQPNGHAFTLIHQCRVAGELAAIAGKRNLLRQIATIPYFDVIALNAGFSFTHCAKCQLRSLSQLNFQRSQVTPARHFTPGVVNNSENHFQVRRNISAIPHLHPHRLSGALSDKIRQRLNEGFA